MISINKSIIQFQNEIISVKINRLGLSKLGKLGIHLHNQAVLIQHLLHMAKHIFYPPIVSTHKTAYAACCRFGNEIQSRNVIFLRQAGANFLSNKIDFRFQTFCVDLPLRTIGQPIPLFLVDWSCFSITVQICNIDISRNILLKKSFL